ncbi:S8 family peptidase [Comamonas sp. CAH-2]|uniref:S8 family peptidase n=1 Tax=Comamonas sp. CAH-2 TaxID=2605745 RepID=UPI0012AE6DED|nr:S8 family peptidase [Comamonas sp. CAH-2]MRT19645.1 S8 family peptidase [Comamonas sp. CAH-2]
MSPERNPIVNPILVLKKEPRRKTVTGRGLNEKQVVSDRLKSQRQKLGAEIKRIKSAPKNKRGNKVLVSIKMFGDSLATTYEPDYLFHKNIASTLVSPNRGGYIAEINYENIDFLTNRLENSDDVRARVLVSRIEEISELISENSPIRGSSEANWEKALDFSGAGKVFNVWLPPFKDSSARAEVVEKLEAFAALGCFSGVDEKISVARDAGLDSNSLQVITSASSNSFNNLLKSYRNDPFVNEPLLIRSKTDFDLIVASGNVYKIEPVRPFVTSEIPNLPDPIRPLVDQQWQPIVGIVDGGLHAGSYKHMVAWQAPSLVSDVDADRVHGNSITSLVVQASGWNPHLSLPSLICRVGIAQAIAKMGKDPSSRVKFKSYLEEVIKAHAHDTKVWNFSFNQPIDGDAPLEMSELGHFIRKLAREYKILPVISIGNVDDNNCIRYNPPADCEAALTVGGRLSDEKLPGDHCPSCLVGPGPDKLTKPELSWFSSVKTIGGSVVTGTSYATALMSSVAAHAFHMLKDPSPDLVKALLINSADNIKFDNKIGWGSPFNKEELPWFCKDGSVTLIWKDSIDAGQWYYWEDIPIPPEFIKEGKLKGRAVLTAILNPKVSELGAANYFSTRLQVALQYKNKSNKETSLLGSMKIEKEDGDHYMKEQEKWNPVRHHARDISNGLEFSGNSMRLCARVFPRDLFQFDLANTQDIKNCEVSFVLTLSAHDEANQGDAIYNSLTNRLGNYVESAVNTVEINISNS